MKIAEVWGATQTEVELDDEHWLKGDDTYHSLSSRRVARGHQNLVCLMTENKRQSVWRDGVQYEFFPATPFSPSQSRSRSKEMLLFLQEWQADIVLLHSANQIQTLFCLQNRIPGTYYILDSNSAAITGIVLDKIAHVPDLLSACIFKARVIRDRFCRHTGYPIERTRVFPSGIDVNTFKPGTQKKTQDCIWVGYLRENNFRKKNVAILMEVFSELDNQLHIVGNGKMVSKLRDMAPPNVTFLGFIEHKKLPKVLGRYKVFLQPSLFDPSPRAVSEALACGLPIIGLKEGLGTEEQIIDSINGYRVSTSAEMQDAIRQLLSHKKLCQDMGLESRKVAETHFNIDIIDRELENFFKEVTSL